MIVVLCFILSNIFTYLQLIYKYSFCKLLGFSLSPGMLITPNNSTWCSPFHSSSRLLVSHLNLEIYHSVLRFYSLIIYFHLFSLLSLYGTAISQMLELVNVYLFLHSIFHLCLIVLLLCYFHNFIFQPLSLIFNSQYLIVIISNFLLLSSSLIFSLF